MSLCLHLERECHVVPQRSSNAEGGASLHRRVLAAASGEALGEGARRQTDARHAQDSARTGNTEASTGKCGHVISIGRGWVCLFPICQLI